MSADDDDDTYEHWPDDFNSTSEAPVAAPRYDSYNGLRDHTYYPPKETPSPSPPPSPAESVRTEATIAHSFAQPQIQAVNDAAVQYNYQPQPAQVAYGQPSPGYYTYVQPQSQPAQVAQHGQTYTYYPNRLGMQPQTNAWMGRTKAEVEEDNMKIAAKEGAYDSRKVAPTEVKDDQLMWVVETDGGHMLRPFLDIKEMKGDWKQDPRFEDSWYFVREAEKEEKMQEKKQGKTKGKKA